MKKTFKLLLLAMLVVSTAISGCKKENDIDDEDDKPNPPQPTPLCDGISGSTAYFPLAVGNSWKYVGSVGWLDTIEKTETINSLTYYNLHGIQGSIEWHQKFRIATNGDVYYRDSNYDEYMEVPANPTLNQQWAYPVGFSVGGKRVVTSLTDTVKTSACTYVNCLKIEERNGNGTVNTTHYYKAGVGKVREKAFNNSDLGAVVFK